MVEQPITLKEYLEIERRSEQRYELVDGQLLALAGETREHYRIARNITTRLHANLRHRGPDRTRGDRLPA